MKEFDLLGVCFLIKHISFLRFETSLKFICFMGPYSSPFSFRHYRNLKYKISLHQLRPCFGVIKWYPWNVWSRFVKISSSFPIQPTVLVWLFECFRNLAYIVCFIWSFISFLNTLSFFSLSLIILWKQTRLALSIITKLVHQIPDRMN